MDHWEAEMHLLDQRSLGIAILTLLGVQVVIKRVATGSILDRPTGSLPIWAADVYNIFFLLIVNPAAAILLITRHAETADPTHLAVSVRWLLVSFEAGGMLLYVGGCILMAWALVSLGRSFQPGGSSPRHIDRMILIGPYRFIRHPMYLAALCISLGLAFLIQSLAGFAVFCIYLLLIVVLIPIEEDGLRRAYGEPYRAYQRTARRLVPHLY
jgi:protein-S-isoprenylcysteine O-methyltransferase Ste14